MLNIKMEKSKMTGLDNQCMIDCREKRVFEFLFVIFHFAF